MKKFFSSIKILPRRFFIYSQNHLVYIDATKTLRYILVSFMSVFFLLGLFLGFFITSKTERVVEVLPEINTKSKHDYVIGGHEWKDSVFLYYQYRARVYLSSPRFENTPITPEMLSLAARNAYDSTGIILPLELALAQAQWESGTGMHGRSPRRNPFNVGEWDTGTVLYFESTFEGVQAYYYEMCTNYLSCRSLNSLLNNFVNCNGHRYASEPQYETLIKTQYYTIQHWIDNKIKENVKTKKL
jgi:hypothetical protein